MAVTFQRVLVVVALATDVDASWSFLAAARVKPIPLRLELLSLEFGMDITEEKRLHSGSDARNSSSTYGSRAATSVLSCGAGQPLQQRPAESDESAAVERRGLFKKAAMEANGAYLDMLVGRSCKGWAARQACPLSERLVETNAALVDALLIRGRIESPRQLQPVSFILRNGATESVGLRHAAFALSEGLSSRTLRPVSFTFRNDDGHAMPAARQFDSLIPSLRAALRARNF